MSDRPRLLLAITVPASARLLRGQMAYAREQGYDVYLISSPGEPAVSICESEGAQLVPIEMARLDNPLRDLASLSKIRRVIREIRPQVVNAGTPKAGLLVMLAASLERVPVRIYTLRGLRLETIEGPKRKLLEVCERVTGACAQNVICVSPSLRERALELRLIPPHKAKVISRGSSNGVNAEHYAPTDELLARGREIRERFGITPDDLVVGFTGRIVRDKGVNELAAAWEILRDEFPKAHLLLVGLIESEDPVTPQTMEILQNDSRIHLAGEVTDTPGYYAAMSMFVLPSYREGLPNVVLEASSMGLPVISTIIPGCVDAVEDGVTGTLLPVGDVPALTEVLRQYLSDETLRKTQGQAGRDRVMQYFRREHIWDGLHELYREMLSQQKPS